MNDIRETTTEAILVKMVISNWELQNTRVNGLLDKLTDDQLLAAVAPDRNRGIYLIGHLTAVSDGMIPLLGLGDKLQPELEDLFIRTPDNVERVYPSLDELKSYWRQVNETLSVHFAAMGAETWLEKHTAISDADFANEPHRNKLNILLNRTNHQSYHLGQLIFLK